MWYNGLRMATSEYVALGIVLGVALGAAQAAPQQGDFGARAGINDRPQVNNAGNAGQWVWGNG